MISKSIAGSLPMSFSLILTGCLSADVGADTVHNCLYKDNQIGVKQYATFDYL
jgi:hypothetical protein